MSANMALFLERKKFAVKFRKNMRRKLGLKVPPLLTSVAHYLAKC